MKILVTGAAGFIGMHTCIALLEKGKEVVGIDNLNKYYDVKLKNDRLKILKKYKNFLFLKIDLKSKKNLENIFKKFKFKFVINLAAQAGVRYSLINPYSYIDSNITGFLNILENCKKYKIKHLLYASSSSVYGANKKIPFSEEQGVNHPISFYAATKRSNELMAHSYSHLYNLPTTGLRFFTVYGPWGRPDMAIFIFTKLISKKKRIFVNNYGLMKRDFTYIDDIVSGIIKVYDKIPKKNLNFNYKKMIPNKSSAPFKIFNIGNNRTVQLSYLIKVIEKNLNLKSKQKLRKMQMGDIKSTYANIRSLSKEVSFRPKTKIEKGVKKFINWYKNYH